MEFDIDKCQFECSLAMMRDSLAGRWLKSALEKIRQQQAELAARQALDDRPLDDDLNVLWNLCEAREPLSLAEQRELYDWLQEKDLTICDYDEKIVALESQVQDLTAEPAESEVGCDD